MRRSASSVLWLVAAWICLPFFIGWGGAGLVQGQWTTQTITLQPGWNAVHLDVQPEPRDCDSVFGGLPVESVWAWNRRFTSLQFLQDASKLIPGQPDWLTYFPLALGDPSLTTLFAVHGGRSYLIKSTAAEPVVWQLQGRPVMPDIDWIKGSLNLVGFPLISNSPPTFGAFLSPSTAHVGQPIFRLSATGFWERVAAPASTPMRAGEAVWIYAGESSSYTGPIAVTLEQNSGIDFGKTLGESVVTLKNQASARRNVVLSQASSEAPRDPSSPALAGNVPLSYWKMDLASKTYGWFPISGPVNLSLASGETLRLRVAVRRPDMSTPAAATGGGDSQYQSILQLTDATDGLRISIPVTARKAGVSSVASANLPAGAPPPPATSPLAGLWVGNAVLRSVSQPANAADPSTPRPTGSEAQFRLIVHVNDAGQARLLQQVTLMWTNGTLDSLGNLDQPGRRVLVTDDSLLSRYTGAALQDGKPVGRRISSIAFSHKSPISMTGVFGDLAGPLGGIVVTPYDDPLNPFKHRFHPDHDNLDEERGKILAEGTESFTVRRALSLKFTETDPEGRASARWGDSQLGGEYTEVISGLHKSDIVVRGIFRLSHVSLIPTLNDER